MKREPFLQFRPLTEEENATFEKYKAHKDGPSMQMVELIAPPVEGAEPAPEEENEEDNMPLFNQKTKDKLFGYRNHTKDGNFAYIILFRAGMPSYSIEAEYELPDKVLGNTISLDALFPFFDEQDTNEIENGLMMMLLCIHDFEQLPLNHIEEPVEPADPELN